MLTKIFLIHGRRLQRPKSKGPRTRHSRAQLSESLPPGAPGTLGKLAFSFLTNWKQCDRNDKMFFLLIMKQTE